jgi:xanthine dehydrogenase accessory factor
LGTTSDEEPVNKYWTIAAELASQGEGFCIALIVESEGSVPRRAGASMLVTADGSSHGTVGGGEVERLCVNEALVALREGKPRLRSFNLNDPLGKETGSICGGKMTVSFHPNPARLKAHVFGAGHVARPTTDLLSTVGYHVVVHDETDEFANKQFFPNAEFQHGDHVTAATELNLNQHDAVLLLTSSHEVELEILRCFKDRLPHYLGVIASKKKVAHFRTVLNKDGWSKTDLDAIHAPIGLDIGARTPEEIAVAIVAEVLKHRGPIE